MINNNNKKNKTKGEIGTFLVIGGLIFFSLVSLSSSYLFNQRQTVKTKASVDITYKCRTESLVWICLRDNHTADQQAKNAFCGTYASLITEGGNNYSAVINKWREEHERNKGFPAGSCSSSPTQIPPTTPAGTQGGGTCFLISADFEVRDEGDKKAFYAWVTFNSNRGGDVKLEYNGIHVAGWNRFGGGSFTYSPQWTQPHTHAHEAGIAALSKGQRIDFTYRGMHSGCSPQDYIISCSVGVKDNGETYVLGNGCSCRNCAGVSVLPTATPTPIGYFAQPLSPSPTYPTRYPPGSYSTPSPSPTYPTRYPPGSYSTPSPSPTQRQISPTATPTQTSFPTPTPDFTQNTNILNTKGMIRGEIDSICEGYCNIVNKNNFQSYFRIKLIKENSGFLGWDKSTYEPKIERLNEDLQYFFENVDRFYGGEREITPNTYSLIIKVEFPNGKKEDIFGKKNFQFNTDEITKSIDKVSYNWKKVFAKVSLNFNYDFEVQKPVRLILNKPFFEIRGDFVEANQLTLWGEYNKIINKDFVYFLGHFYGTSSLVNYEILWSCREGNQVRPYYSSDPNLNLEIEGNWHYIINTNISCGR